MNEFEYYGHAFPNSGNGNDCPGMSLREYAAIKLRVPNSGIEWLDDMITQSVRDELAAKAMEALTVQDKQRDDGWEDVANLACGAADAMIKEMDY